MYTRQEVSVVRYIEGSDSWRRKTKLRRRKKKKKKRKRSKKKGTRNRKEGKRREIRKKIRRGQERKRRKGRSNEAPENEYGKEQVNGVQVWTSVESERR